MTSSAPEPRAIFFDLDGTIVDWQTGMDDHWRAVCGEACEREQGVEAAALFDAIVARRTWFWGNAERARTGRMNLNDASRQIVGHALEDLGRENIELAHAIADEYRARRQAALCCFPRAVETLEEVRRRGIRMALITNGSAQAQRGTIERFDLARHFDCVIVEGEFGAGKPDERLFRQAMASCGVEPGETWMIGDSLEADIAPAVALGMHAIWVDFEGRRIPPDVAVRPHRTVRTIAELFEEQAAK